MSVAPPAPIVERENLSGTRRACWDISQKPTMISEGAWADTT